jgi:hypothetical protein
MDPLGEDVTSIAAQPVAPVGHCRRLRQQTSRRASTRVVWYLGRLILIFIYAHRFPASAGTPPPMIGR